MERTIFAFQEQWLLRNADGVTVVSRELEKITTRMRTSSDRLLYLPNCVEDAPPGIGKLVRMKHGIPTTSPVVLLYTRFFEFNQQKLYSVLSAIHQAIPEVRFLVVGKGRQGEEDKLVAAARADNFASSIVLAGWVEPGDLPNHLAAADAAIYPFDDTLLNRCKCPAKLTEIMCAAVPVAADSVGQVCEYIENGVSGFLCEPDDSRALADATIKLLQDARLRSKLGVSGRERLLSTFNWRIYSQQLNRFYQRSFK